MMGRWHSMGVVREIALHGTPLRILRGRTLCPKSDVETCGENSRFDGENQEQNVREIKEMKGPAPPEMCCADGESANLRENDAVAWARTAAELLVEVVASALVAAIVSSSTSA